MYEDGFRNEYFAKVFPKRARTAFGLDKPEAEASEPKRP